MMSSPSVPEASPLPYVIEKAVERFLKDEDEDESNVVMPLQLVVQLEPAIHKSLKSGKKKKKEDVNWDRSINSVRRSAGASQARLITYAEPVSRITSKATGGVPTANEPK